MILLEKDKCIEQTFIYPQQLCKHGLIVGSTGSGKTQTMKSMVEQLSNSYTNSIVIDAKGDINNLANIDDPSFKGWVNLYDTSPTWDEEVNHGIPYKLMISDLNIDDLALVFNLTDAQTVIIYKTIMFKNKEWSNYTDIESLIVDLKEYQETKHGCNKMAFNNLIANLEMTDLKYGGFFGERHKEYSITDNVAQFMSTIGIINVKELVKIPDLYQFFILGILNKLTEQMIHETDDVEMCVFIDEAHLFFKNSNKKFIEKMETYFRTVRSKGISLWLLNQSYAEIPKGIMSNINTILHHKVANNTSTAEGNRKVAKTLKTLGCYEKSDNKGVFYRIDDIDDIVKKLTTLKVGTCLVQTLNENGESKSVYESKVSLPLSYNKPAVTNGFKKNRDWVIKHYERLHPKTNIIEELYALVVICIISYFTIEWLFF